MFRVLCLVVFLFCVLPPKDGLAQRQKKSIISGGSPDKVETKSEEKKADIFDKPSGKSRASTKGNKQVEAMLAKRLSEKGKSGKSEEGELPEPEIVTVNSRLPGTEGITTIVNQEETVDYSDFRKADFATIGQDLEACKRYLMQFNNEGKLNINMLSMLAVGDMCPIVTEWVLRDWSFASRGRLKQGKDVQSLMLVSPKRRFKTFSMSHLAKAPLLSGKGNWHIPMLVIWGGESKSAKETKAVYKALVKNRPPSEAAMSADRWAEQDLYMLDLPLADEGAELLRPNEALYNFIATFNQQKVVLNASRFPWQSRGKKKAK